MRRLISELDNEQNILYRDVFVQSGDFKQISDKFNKVFSYRKSAWFGFYRHSGIYFRVTGHMYDEDLDRKGNYIGKYPILNKLHEVFQELSDAYVFGNEKLDKEQFKNKIHELEKRQILY